MRDGWIQSTLGDLISHSIGGIWGEDPGNSEVDVPVYRQTEFDDSGVLRTPADAFRSISKSQLKSRTLQHGDILIQKSAGTPTLPGRVVMVPDLKNEIATFSNFLNLLRPDEAICIPRFAFLYFWFKHHTGRAFEFQRGTNIKNLDLPNYLKEKILLPPLPEQKRIVDLISSVDSYIEALRKQLEGAKRSRNAVLHELLTAGGDDWVEITLDEIADVIMGQSPDGKTYNQEGKGLPFMQGSAEFGEHNPVPEKWCSDPKKIAEAGDLLLSVRAPVGDTNFANQRIAVGRGLSVIRANKKSLTEFIRLVIQLSVAELIAKSGSGMFASITGKNLREFKIYLPPLAEQKRIVEIINTIDVVISQTKLTTSKAQILRSGLLSDLLSGKHEIPASYEKVMDTA